MKIRLTKKEVVKLSDAVGARCAKDSNLLPIVEVLRAGISEDSPERLQADSINAFKAIATGRPVDNEVLGRAHSVYLLQQLRTTLKTRRPA
jgi:hypothetical protein